jgi:hypothetical protein
MFHSLFRYAGGCFTQVTAHRAVTRAAGLAALTVLIFGTLSGPAAAQGRIFNGGWTAQPAADANTPLRCYFTKLTCLDETDDGTIFSNSDEPYLLFLVADLRGSNSSGVVFTSQTFSDVDKNETRSDMLQIWALNGTAQPIGSDNDYIMLAALMEEDHYLNGSQIVLALRRRVLPKLVQYKAAGMSRAVMVGALRSEMDAVIGHYRRSIYNREDDRIGGTFEILWGPDRLNAARSGVAMNWSGLIVGAGSKYLLELRLQQ